MKLGNTQFVYFLISVSESTAECTDVKEYKDVNEGGFHNNFADPVFGVLVGVRM